MKTGVVMLNFGEPSEPDREIVTDYLERIFLANASLEGGSDDDRQRRARELAERRTPGLLEEYETIGGSPLGQQAFDQAEALHGELRDRGHDVETYVGMQFTPPFVADAVESAHADDVDVLVGLPMYPLCGPSTTVASLEELSDAVHGRDWDVPLHEVTGWHKHPTYNRLRADTVTSFAADSGVDLADPETLLLFSAHGTPRHYLDAGSRYAAYVEEYCAAQAGLLGVDDYALGYQNHGNRDIPWTEPEVEDVVANADAERVVVEPVSFVHEQSETLSELDDELREDATDAGLAFHRVPVPHDDPRLAAALGDLVEPFAAGVDSLYYNLQSCLCRDAPGAVCLNAGPNRVTERADTRPPE